MKSILFIPLALLIIIGCESAPHGFSPADTNSEPNDMPGTPDKVSGAPAVASVVELGAVSKPPTVTTRDGGESAVENIKIIGQGPNNNLLMRVNFHVTVHPDGTVTGFVDNSSIVCQ